MLNTNTNYPLVRAICVILPAFITYAFMIFDLIGAAFSFLVITVLMLLYTAQEILLVRKFHPARWVLNPVVFCATFTFLLAYGISNIILIAPMGVRAAVGMASEINNSTVKVQLFAIIAVIFLFLGYWSRFGNSLSSLRSASSFERIFLNGLDVPRLSLVIILLVFSIIVRIVAIQIGLFGYSGDYSTERLAETSAFSQYLSVASNSGMLALVIAALSIYGTGKTTGNVSVFWAAIVVEIVFAFLAGMKTGFVMPFAVTIICSYLCTGKVAKAWWGVVLGAIVLSYAVVEPFRAARNEIGGALTSTSAIFEVLIASDSRDVQNSDINVGWRILGRSNATSMGSLGIEYADTNDSLSSAAPAFLADLFLAPAHAVIPRAIWTSKPLGSLGLWYTQEVLGFEFMLSSTAMGPITYLYFAGGIVAIAAFFFLLGLFHRWLWFVTRPWASLSGAVILLSILSIVTFVDSAVNGIIISLVRIFPLILLFARISFRRARDGETLALRPGYNF